LKAEPGQSITLPCQVPDNSAVNVVEWSRASSPSEYVLLYRDEQLDPDYQLKSFRNRVDLAVRPVKDGNVSLVLQNVTNDDGGTYECRVFPEKANKRKRAVLRTKPISVVKLEIVPPEGQMKCLLNKLAFLCLSEHSLQPEYASTRIQHILGIQSGED
uniref:Ig-like domain-containing protein n=1 Tax=Fundulus heteroclitus TaxID=8078 RepID=A0A3Q2QYI3_FUNHE